MTESRRSRLRFLVHLVMVSALGAALLFIGVGSVFAADKTIEGNSSTSTWSPSTATVSPGGTVEFKNISTTTPHALGWNEGNPETPSCPGIPSVGQTGPWSGTCTFVQIGTYSFHCTVHPAMTGTITVTGPATPSVTTGNATAIKKTEATLNGAVNPKGQETTYFFEYGTTDTYGEETPETSAGDSFPSMPLGKGATVTGLTASTTYHFRMVAENASGTTTGGDATFTTAGPPTATTNSAAGIGGVEATLAGTVNPKGLSTSYFFKYGTSTTYDHTTAPEKSAGSGTADAPATQLVTGLSPSTVYHFQVVAKNSDGDETEGLDQTFTTLGPPTANTETAGGIGDVTATLEGSVNPQNQLTSYYFNYGETNAYDQKTAEKTVSKGTTNVPASIAVSGLSPETTYHFQLVATSAAGTTGGTDKEFTTGSTPPPPPSPLPPLPAPPVIPPETGGAPPDTKITLKPTAKTRDTTPTIKFKATVGGASYQCSVDSKPFKSCRSPFTAPSLKPGSHKIRVKAVVGGVADPTPASCSFKVLAKKRG
jgi:plastocyanin